MSDFKYKTIIPDVEFWKAMVPCQAACPVNTDAGRYVQLVAQGKYEEAYFVARAPNPLALVCGRLCAAPCEERCRRGKIDAPVSIRALKRFVTERYDVESLAPDTQGKLRAGAVAQGNKLRGHFIGSNGHIEAAEFIGVKRPYDEQRHFSPEFDENFSETFKADSVIFAIGQQADLSFIKPEDGIEIIPQGTIKVGRETRATSAPSLFAGGDVAFGPRNLIEAVANGKRAALSIDDFLRSAEQQDSAVSGDGRDYLQSVNSREHARYRSRYSFSIEKLPTRSYIMPEDCEQFAHQAPPTIALDRHTGISEVETGYHEAQARQQAERCLSYHIQTVYDALEAAQIPTGLQQIWVKDLNRVDRCTTCHQGMEWKGLESAPHPFRAHPLEILQAHSLNQLGCTACHGGQGYAAEVKAAHGQVEHWEEPLLGKRISDIYLIKDKKALMQVNCNSCHCYDRETKGADFINEAKHLVQEKSCRACHTINGRGGTIGPDLTNVGDKSPEQYDYGCVSGVKSAFAWHVAHFQKPKAMVPETIMPDFNFSSRQAQALTLLVLSWEPGTALPARYIPGARQMDRPAPEELAKEKQMLEGEGAFFVKKGCFICHSVDSLGITNTAKIGPDLSEAVSDVQSRFVRTLEDFLKQAMGTMAVVLATQIQLTDEEQREAVERLKIAYQRKQKGAKPEATPTPAPKSK